MRVALAPLILIVASSHAHTSVLFTGSNDTCQSCVCGKADNYQDSFLESVVPERALEEAQDIGSEHGEEHGSEHGDDAEHAAEHGSGHGEEHGAGHSSGQGSGHSSGHGSAHWWGSEDQRWAKEHFDAWVIMVLVIITLLFEMLHHKTHHFAEHAGHLHLDAHVHKHDHEHIKRIHTRSLWLDLHHRCSSELAVLGFLACMVWTSNQIGVFEWLAEANYSDVAGIPLPLTAHDYLHHVEMVHMHLFITMCFYFMLMAIVTFIATRLIRKSVEANHYIVNKAKDKIKDERAIASPISLEMSGEHNKFITRFNWFREYYFISLERWRGQWEFFDKHMEYLRAAIEKDARMFGLDTVDFPNMTMPEILRDWFPYDLYLVVNYRNLVDEMIEVKFSTWLAILVFLMSQAFLKRGMRQNIPVTSVWALVCQVVVLVMLIACYIFYRKMYSTVREGYQECLPKFAYAHRLKPIKPIMHTIQIACFFTIWELASTISSRGTWEEYPGWNVIYAFVLVFGGVVEGVILGYTLPILSALVSSGAWMQQNHVLHFQTILKALGRANDRQSAELAARKLGQNIKHFDEQLWEDEDEAREEMEEMVESI